MFMMIEPRSDRVVNTQTKHHCYQVIRTTKVHQSSKSSRIVTVQEKVIRSRLQMGYSTPTNFINRYLCYILIYLYNTNVDNDHHYNYYLIFEYLKQYFHLKFTFYLLIPDEYINFFFTTKKFPIVRNLQITRYMTLSGTH